MKRRPRAQHGLTLVELMLALAVGLLLIAASVQVFSSMSQNARAQENLARMQETGRLALELISREIRLAGYESKPFPRILGCTDTANGSDCAIFGTDGGADQSDGLTIRFRSDGHMRGCTGREANEKDTVWVDSFRLDASTLRCNDNGQTQPLLDGIRRLDFGYLVEGTANYVDEPAASDWPRVIGVRITVEVANARDTNRPLTFTTTVGLRNRLR